MELYHPIGANLYGRDKMTGKEIREWRKQMGLTQERLAQLIGVSFQTVNRWERGIFKPSNLAIEKVQLLISRQQGKIV